MVHLVPDAIIASMQGHYSTLFNINGHTYNLSAQLERTRVLSVCEELRTYDSSSMISGMTFISLATTPSKHWLCLRELTTGTNSLATHTRTHTPTITIRKRICGHTDDCLQIRFMISSVPLIVYIAKYLIHGP